MMKQYSKIAFVLGFSITTATVSTAQNVAINTTGAAANTSAGLDIDFTTKGFLLPRMTAAQRAAITTPATGLIVYQTDAGTMGAGFYFYNGTTWVPWGTNNGGWGLSGNTGTAVATNFLGTTDNVDFAIRTNNTERLRVMGANGRIGIGTSAPGYTLEVSSGTGDAIYGHSTNVGGFMGYETNFSVGTSGGSLNGSGYYSSNPAAGYASIYAQSTGSATVAANISYSSVWMATYNLVENSSATYNPSASYSQLSNTSTTLGGTQVALRGYNFRGTTTGNPGYSVGTQGIGDSQNQDSYGVQGYAFCNTNTRAGGYFEADNYAGTLQAYAYVATSYLGTNRKITGTNSVSEIVPTPNHGRVTLTCPESPEYWYQDYGTVKLVNGKAHVDLDPILAEIIFVNEQNPLRVFCTPVDMLDYNGVAIINKTGTGFDIVEVNGGTHSGTIDYQVIVKPKTNYGEGRFQQAPGPGWLKPEEEPASAKAANNPGDGRVIFHWPSDAETYHYEALAKRKLDEIRAQQKISKDGK